MLSRSTLVAAVAATGFAAGLQTFVAAQSLRKITIAEPAHFVGYIPLYVALDQGLFERRGLDVTNITATGGAHVSALVSGDVWANLGGPESDAMANVGKADPLRAVCNLINRAIIYLCAKKGLAPRSHSDADIAAMLRGKRIAGNRFGGSGDVLLRWYLAKIGLDPKNDVTIVNNADAAVGPLLIKQGQVDVCITQEPQIAYGVEQGVWDEPFFGFPSLGDFPLVVASVRGSTATREPQVVQAFTNGMIDALRVTASNRAVVDAVAHKEFPTLPEAGVKATLDRNYVDHAFSADGFISEKGFALDIDIAVKAGELSKAPAYADLVDMQFVRKAPRR